MIRWLAMLALLWPLSASAGGGTFTPVVSGGDAAAAQPAAAGPAFDCPPALDRSHVHCHHIAHTALSTNAATPEDTDDPGSVAYPTVSRPVVGATLPVWLRPVPRPSGQSSFILFGNFRS